jgi:hypothetical protein
LQRRESEHYESDGGKAQRIGAPSGNDALGEQETQDLVDKHAASMLSSPTRR